MPVGDLCCLSRGCSWNCCPSPVFSYAMVCKKHLLSRSLPNPPTTPTPSKPNADWSNSLCPSGGIVASPGSRDLVCFQRPAVSILLANGSNGKKHYYRLIWNRISPCLFHGSVASPGSRYFAILSTKRHQYKQYISVGNGSVDHPRLSAGLDPILADHEHAVVGKKQPRAPDRQHLFDGEVAARRLLFERK